MEACSLTSEQAQTLGRRPPIANAAVPSQAETVAGPAGRMQIQTLLRSSSAKAEPSD